MKKSRPSPKEMLKKRLAKLVNPLHSKRICKSDEKEYVKPVLKKQAKIKGRDIDSILPNEENYIPYNLPKHMRMFITQTIKRKVGPQSAADMVPRTVCDIDEQFFSVIEGRPMRQFCDLKVYMKHLRDTTLFRANAAFMNDQIKQINTTIKDESDEYKKIYAFFVKCKDNFVKFAKENYEEAKEIQNLALDRTAQMEKILEELEGYSYEFVKVRNHVSTLIAMYEPLSMYKKFLNSMSPAWWQQRYAESCALGSKLCAQFAEDLSSLTTTSVQSYKQSAMQLKELQPTLYFKKPSEIIDVFENDRSYGLYYLQIASLGKRTIKSVIKHRDCFKVRMKYECKSLQAYVDGFKESLAFYEQCALEYEHTFDTVLVNEFERLFASYDSIKLFTCVQYVQTKLYEAAEDPRDRLSTMMCDIERFYIRVTKDLDTLDQNIVKDATNKMFSDDIKRMNRAHKARRLLHDCDILSKGLYTSFEPPRKQTNKYKEIHRT